MDIQKEIQQAMKHHEEFITSLNAEIRARKLLLTALEQADKFYRNQRRDVKKVVYVRKVSFLMVQIVNLSFFRRTKILVIELSSYKPK